MKNGRKNETQCSTRRDFLKTLSRVAASAIIAGSCEMNREKKPESPEPEVFPPRAGKQNPFVTASGRPLLVCVSGDDFEEMLAAGLSTLGGLGQLIGPNQDVLIKPNCNAPDPYPAVSSLSSVLSIIKELKKITGGVIRVGDQGYYSSGSVYGSIGLDPAVGEAGATLLTLRETCMVRHSDWPATIPGFFVYADIYNAPIIINACVLKRHSWATFSCAIKNNVGCVAGPSASITRRYLHYQSPNLMIDVAEIASLVNPELNIVDARSVLTHGGPFYKDGIAVEAAKLVLCGDIVATDAYCAQILANHDPEFQAGDAFPTLNQAEKRGMGTADLGKVQIIEIAI